MIKFEETLALKMFQFLIGRLQTYDA